MSRFERSLIAIGATALTLVLGSTSLAELRYSEFGGSQQVWLTADSFAARAGDANNPLRDPEFVGDTGTHWDADPTATGQLTSAYHFRSHTDPATFHGPPEQRDWWVQYDIPVSQLPGNFNFNGTPWYIWVRASMPDATSEDSNWLLMNGDPGDLNKANPTDNDWYNWPAATDLVAGDPTKGKVDQTPTGDALDGDASLERLANDLSINVPAGREPAIMPVWVWTGVNPDTRLRKITQVHDGKVTFRIYEREAAGSGVQRSARHDVFLLTNGFGYVPDTADPTSGAPFDDDFGAATVAGGLDLGDMNGDGAVNNLDIAPFSQALTDPAAFQAAYPDVPLLTGDINENGEFNNLDIAPFSALLVGGPAAVPEPATWLLACLGGAGLLVRRIVRSGRRDD